MNLLKLFAKKKKVKNGTWREYNKHAVIVTEGTFLNDVKHGMWRYYYDTGSLAIEEVYAHGKMHGTYRSFFPNGNVMSEGCYEQDSREGYFQVYDEQGRLIRLMLYARNVLITDTPQSLEQPAVNVLTALPV